MEFRVGLVYSDIRSILCIRIRIFSIPFEIKRRKACVRGGGGGGCGWRRIVLEGKEDWVFTSLSTT